MVQMIMEDKVIGGSQDKTGGMERKSAITRFDS